MAYTDLAGIRQVIGSDALAVVAPPTDSTDDQQAGVAVAVVTAALAAVSSEIDAALRSRYTLPLKTVPDFLSRLAAHLTHEALCDDAAITDLIKARASDARKTLTHLARGVMMIEGETPTSGAGQALNLTANKRAFTRAQTAGVL